MEFVCNALKMYYIKIVEYLSSDDTQNSKNPHDQERRRSGLRGL